MVYHEKHKRSGSIALRLTTRNADIAVGRYCGPSFGIPLLYPGCKKGRRPKTYYIPHAAEFIDPWLPLCATQSRPTTFLAASIIPTTTTSIYLYEKKRNTWFFLHKTLMRINCQRCREKFPWRLDLGETKMIENAGNFLLYLFSFFFVDVVFWWNSHILKLYSILTFLVS